MKKRTQHTVQSAYLCKRNKVSALAFPELFSPAQEASWAAPRLLRE